MRLFWADLIVSVHLLYVIFTVGGAVLIVAGGAAGWRWVRNRTFRLIHFAAVLLVALEAAGDVFCPLTVWEYRLRLPPAAAPPGGPAGGPIGGPAGGPAGGPIGGPAGPETTFIADLVHRIIFYEFPAWVFTAAYILFAALVGALLLLIPPRPRRPRS